MRLLIVGLGSIGSRHAASAARISGVETAGFDPAPGQAERISRRLGLPCYSDWRKALEWRPKAAVVAVPTSHHIPVARELIESGAHVLVEKPISNQIDVVDSFLRRAQKLRRGVYVVCNMRFHPAIKTVREILPKVGKPLFARAHYGNYLPDMRPETDYHNLYCARQEMGGGVVLDAIHEVDYLTWLFGPAASVSCQAAKLSDLDIDVEDYAHLCMTHLGNLRSEIHLDYLRRYKRRGLEVTGTKGTLIWLSKGKNPEQCTVRLHTIEKGWETILKEKTLDASSMYFELMADFVKAVKCGNSSMLLDGHTAAKELKTALAAHRSAKEHKSIRVE